MRPRSGIRPSVLAGADERGLAVQRVPHAVSRQVQPGAFLLGRDGFGGEPVLRQARAAPRGGGPDDPRGIFARGDQWGLLAGGCPIPGARLLCVFLPGASRFSSSQDSAAAGVLQRRVWRVPSPLRRCASGVLTAKGGARLFADYLRGGGHLGWLGPRFSRAPAQLRSRVMLTDRCEGWSRRLSQIAPGGFR